MGVFSRFRRKSRTTAEASTEEAAVSTLTAEPSAEADSGSEASKDAVAEVTEAEAGEVAEATAAEGVEIPKQQSAEEAADNEAGEGARK
ncbi:MULTISPECIES: hypothetical protein [unclassified Streptomyces]|uniref:hypothetical protein n=1 Tax=unclassified Streptomyces TaxID=2593676 RepID=UPI002DDAFC3D|nr:hypothetical protein [Streptomyces sp. NBC_01750]WSA99832.1 hypothetical protein OIE54_11395 [Streptomyces sp. NBC_01794]WSD35736.1 hypothetical protein OG966_29870 [Streptomyces sp. NBC_01750]